MLRKRIFYFVQIRNSSKTCFLVCKHEKRFKILFFHFEKIQNASRHVYSFCKYAKRFENVFFILERFKMCRKRVFFHSVNIQKASKTCFLLFCKNEKMFWKHLFHLQTWKTLRKLFFSFCKYNSSHFQVIHCHILEYALHKELVVFSYYYFLK